MEESGNMPKHYSLNRGEFREGMELCISKASRLLGDARFLLRDEGETRMVHSFGLYLLALEEYGQALCMGDLSPGREKVDVPAWILATDSGSSRERKIRRALGDLPADSGQFLASSVWSGLRESDGRPAKSYGRGLHLVDLMKGRDFGRTLASLLVTWDDSRSRWNLEYEPDRAELTRAIKALESKLTIR